MMKRATFVCLAFALLAAGCGSTVPSQANRLIFSADLKASNEVPPISNADSGGVGNATITFDVTRDGSGNITAANATWVVNISGLPPNTPIILSHIHQAPAGTNGTVVVNTGLAAASPVTLANGSGSFERTTTLSPLERDVLTQIINNPAGFYFNSHSALNPGGVVRGQLQRVQ
jgi:hypothetical protein